MPPSLSEALSDPPSRIAVWAALIAGASAVFNVLLIRITSPFPDEPLGSQELVIPIVSALCCSIYWFCIGASLRQRSGPKLVLAVLVPVVVSVGLMLAGGGIYVIACCFPFPTLGATATALVAYYVLPTPLVEGVCHRCNYDLRGNVSGRCPECGQPVEPRHTDSSGSLR